MSLFLPSIWHVTRLCHLVNPRVRREQSIKSFDVMTYPTIAEQNRARKKKRERARHSKILYVVPRCNSRDKKKTRRRGATGKRPD